MFTVSLNPTPALAKLDAADAEAVIYRRSYHEALDIVLQLWDQAKALNPDIGNDWRNDVEVDISVARTLDARP